MNDKTTKLLAESAEGLTVISAKLQDAIVRVSDVKFSKDAASLTVTASRYEDSGSDKKGSRIRAALRLNNVLSMKARGIDRSDPDAFMVLLSLVLEPEDKGPGGALRLIFAGGGEICAQIDCIEARLVDIAQPRATSAIPMHPDI